MSKKLIGKRPPKPAINWGKVVKQITKSLKAKGIYISLILQR